MPRVPRVPECPSAQVPFQCPSPQVPERPSAQVPWVPECPSAQVSFECPSALIAFSTSSVRFPCESKFNFNFLELNSVIYDLQFGFRQKYWTFHALIHLTDKIREQIDSGNFTCEIFVNLQKAFDTDSKSWYSYTKIESLWH